MAMDLTGFVPRRKEIVIGTKVFKFSELSIGDLATFEAEMKQQKEAANEKRRQRLLSYDVEIDAVELLKLIDQPITDEELEAQMETVAGMGTLAYLSLRKAYPEISRDDAANIVTMESLGEITAFLFPEKDDSKKKPKITKKQ